LFCLNRGVVITPFHNMMLVCPQTKAEHVARLLDVLDQGMSQLSGAAAARTSTN
jgi:glutamate-1-semialdehyde 2,1-aminomutase